MNRWRTIGIWSLLFTSTVVTAQHHVRLPLEGGAAEVTFTYQPVSTVSASGDGLIEATGKVTLPGPGAVGIRFSNFVVKGFAGVDSVDSVVVTLEFPADFPVNGDGVVTLSRRSPAGALVLNVTEGMILDQPVTAKVTAPRFSTTTSFQFTQAIVISRIIQDSLANAVTDTVGGPREEKIVLTQNEPPQVSTPPPTPDEEEVVTEEAPIPLTPVTDVPFGDRIDRSVSRANRPMTYSHTQVGSRHTFIFTDVEKLEVVDAGAAMGLSVLEDTAIDAFQHRLVINSSVPGFHRVEVIDRTKAVEYQRLGVHLDSRLSGALEETDATVAFSKLTGGTPPYKLAFYRGQEYIATLEDVAPAGLTIAKTDILGYQPEGGVISVRMVDANNAGEFFFDGQTVSVTTVDAISGSNTAWYWLAGLSALALIYLAFQNRTRDRKRGHLSKVRQEMREDDAPPTPRTAYPRSGFDDGAAASAFAREVDPLEAPGIAEADTEVTIGKEEGDGTEGDAQPRHGSDTSEPSKKSSMRISRRTETDSRISKPFAPDEPDARHLMLPMSRHWESTMITELFLGTEAVDRLDEFLHRENVDKIVATGSEREQVGWERNESVPEIGGMLMGQFKRVKGELTYRVSIEKFVPLEAKYQSVTKVEIDPMSLARDLGDAQDENPDLIVVGWFHTHPGHGLFLSRPDLKIHYSHFHRPYHLAMEIDSLSERLDTGFFTYMPSGHMNNSATLRPDTAWYSWAKIRQQHR